MERSATHTNFDGFILHVLALKPDVNARITNLGYPRSPCRPPSPELCAPVSKDNKPREARTCVSVPSSLSSLFSTAMFPFLDD